jgi:hypothetical protein
MLFSGQASGWFSLSGTAFQLPLVSVPACQAVTLALAHVDLQFESDSGAFSLIPCSQQAEDEIAIRRSRILGSDFRFFRAERQREPLLGKIDVDLARLRGDEPREYLLSVFEGNLDAGHRGMGQDTGERTFQRTTCPSTGI